MKRVIGSVIVPVLVVVAMFGMAGCGQGSKPQTKPSPSESRGEIGIPSGETPGTPTYPDGKRPVDISMERTGGIAGVHQKIQISADGSWTYEDKGKAQTGKLTDPQVSKLQSLVLDDRLSTEARHKDTRKCADGFNYTLNAGEFSMTAVDCGGFEERPAFTALVKYVKDVTPM